MDHKELINRLRCDLVCSADIELSAADAIESLLKEREATWISVNDKLPEFDTDVIFWFQKSKLFAVGSILLSDDDIEHWTCNTGGEWYTDCDTRPSYWMPLPAPPHE